MISWGQIFEKEVATFPFPAFQIQLTVLAVAERVNVQLLGPPQLYGIKPAGAGGWDRQGIPDLTGVSSGQYSAVGQKQGR